MLLPLLLIVLATLSASVVVYGTFPQWAVHDSGLQVIEMCRRLQWPLFTVSLLLCMTLTVLVVIGRRRIFWLLGFAPVFALFLQHFVTGTIPNLRVVDSPAIVPAPSASFVRDDEYVVGVVFNGQAFAFPYRQLFNNPVVIVQEREKHMALFWSAFANRATACTVNRQIRARELDIVSMPANAILVYNSRVGEFINGFTGLTPEGKKPNGFGTRLPTTTMVWRDWKALHPESRVSFMPTLSTAPAGPVLPQFPMRSTTRPSDERVVLFDSLPAVAVPEDRVGADVINLSVAGQPVLIFRDANGRLRAFERRFADRESRFHPNPSTRRAAKGVVMLDVATNSGWTVSGIAVDGDSQVIGQKLAPVTSFDEGAYWCVVKEWLPDAQLVEP